jgi:uncharacterized membrane protein (DUF106 family)
MTVFSPVIDVSLLAVVVGVISQVLQRKLMNKKEQKEKQERMKEKQKRLKELMQKNDEKSRKEAERLNAELMEDMKSMFGGMKKYMIASFVVVLPIFYLGVSSYKNAEFVVFGWTVPHFIFPPYIVWYFISSIIFSVIFNAAMKAIEK